uniref:Pyranose 2-oxidase n=1 Tax=Lyophyllum shimeji TaxID=47721 RepID=P2OX_LYOSH|nr:RecName: Full=Pyranose 2-oxidase; Short=P2Ox; Short=POD; Short=POx; Short=PROD; Short=Pyranose oxidase; AltName: Full=FAD-oxidoreductase; AltName: Full=Glucose 2-oxidase; AltName: Full=Pyranose:oxygen 2-oxidoreductase [Lyophyllum shimeji]BAD12079.1 pyranose oxidase [Lyophyllum shimeji]
MSLSTEQMLRDYPRSMQINGQIPKNAIHETYGNDGVDVFIAGSGPIGATYAKLCVEAGLRVVMVEIGAADSFYAVNAEEGTAVPYVPGYHKKNEIEFQKDIDRFVNVIKGALQQVSVPVRNQNVPTLDPGAWSAPPGSSAISNGKNPHQREFENLSAEAVTRGVGGMSTHWTCSTPRIHPPMESLPGIGRPKLSNDPAEDDKEWNELYSEAERLIGTSTKEFDESIRHTLVLRSLQDAYKDRQRIFRPLPLACHRLKNAPEYVEWHSAENLFHSIYNDDKQKKLFTLLTNHRCTRLALTGGYEKKIGAAEVRNLLATRNPSSQLDSYIMAKVYVLASGAIGNPQILYNSGFSGLQVTPRNDSLIPNLGRYITEQPMAFCQIVLRQEFVDSVRDDPYGLPWWKEAVAQHIAKNPTDALPIPFRDPEPQVTTPFTEEHPWHTQIHRDAFSYGAVGPEVDSRVIVDLRWFGATDPEANNLLVFQNDVQDGYSMPQPTFRYRPSTASNVRARKMMADMCEVASNLGGYLPTSPPQFMDPGLALHLAGTTRIGFDKATTVADNNSLVWDFANLYVAGNGTIRTGFGENPTLTSMCHAIKSARSIINTLKGGTDGKNTGEHRNL